MSSENTLVQQIAALQEYTASLEVRLQVMEDVEEIRALHATYHDYVDKGWDGKLINPAGLREVFTEDVSWGATPEAFTADQQSSGLTTHQGVETVIDMLQEATSVFEMAMHSMLNVKIVVRGDVATGTRHDWVATRANGQPNLWWLKGAARYLRTADGWRIQRIELRFVDRLLPLHESI